MTKVRESSLRGQIVHEVIKFENKFGKLPRAIVMNDLAQFNFHQELLECDETLTVVDTHDLAHDNLITYRFMGVPVIKLNFKIENSELWSILP